MFVRIWLLVAVVAAGLVVPLQAGQRRIIGDPARDVRLTTDARKLLADNAELAAWNIGVMVNDRIAVLWGPAPSAELAFRAELCLKSMVELVEVRNELIVTESLEPMVRPIKPDVRPRNVPELMPPRLPGQPVLKESPSAVLAGRPNIVPAQVTTASKMPASVMVNDGSVSDADRALTASIRIFLESKTSYSVVQYSVQDRRVYLKAARENSDTLHEVARGIARLPNVEGVILSESVPPR